LESKAIEENDMTIESTYREYIRPPIETIAASNPDATLVLLMKGERIEFETRSLIVDDEGIRVPGLFDVPAISMHDMGMCAQEGKLATFRMKVEGQDLVAANDLCACDYVECGIMVADWKHGKDWLLDTLWTATSPNEIVMIDGKASFLLLSTSQVSATVVDGTTQAWTLSGNGDSYVLKRDEIAFVDSEGGYGTDIITTEGSFIHVELAYGMKKAFDRIKTAA
jgi:hypothetical protein